MLWADITTDFFARSYFSWIENVVGRAAVKKSVTLRVLQLLSGSLSGVLLNCWTVASPRAEVLDSRLAWGATVRFLSCVSIAGLPEGYLSTSGRHLSFEIICVCAWSLYMAAVFTFSQDLARIILEWVPCLARLAWMEGNWCFEMEYRSISIVVAKEWYVTCLEHLNRKGQSVMTSRRLGDVHTAEIFFESDIKDISSPGHPEDIRRLFSRDKREFVDCLEKLKDLTCATRELEVLRVTIPYISKTSNLMKVAKWILDVHFRRKRTLHVSIHIPVGVCVETVSPSGKLSLGRFSRVHPRVIRVLNVLLYSGVRVKSLTYIRHRWVRHQDLLDQRKAACEVYVKVTDFVEIDDVRLAFQQV